MKKTILKIAVIGLITSGLLMFVGGCKRNAQEDPDVYSPSGHRVRLTGRAEPSVLYIPQGNQTVSSEISVTAQNNDGTPVLNRSLIFQTGAYGYFDDYELTVAKNLNDLGRANATFYIPAGTNSGDTITYLKVILADNAMLHNALAEVYDYIPIRIVPYGNQGMIRIHGYVTNGDGDGIQGIPIVADNAGVTFTRPSGSYDMLIPYGWFGTITPGSVGEGAAYTFFPTSYTYSDPVYTDLDNVNFVGVLTSPATLATNIENFEVIDISSTTTEDILVWNSTSTAEIDFFATSEVDWISIDIPASGLATCSDTEATVTFTVTPPTTSGAYTGNIVIMARDSLVGNSPINVVVTITIP